MRIKYARNLSFLIVLLYKSFVSYFAVISYCAVVQYVAVVGRNTGGTKQIPACVSRWGVPRSDGAQAKKHVWRPHVQT